jgi:hypothetical protein
VLQHVTMRWHALRSVLPIESSGGPVMSLSQCAACGAIVPHYDTVNTVSEGYGDRLLCAGCFNREMAHQNGLDSLNRST